MSLRAMTEEGDMPETPRESFGDPWGGPDPQGNEPTMPRESSGACPACEQRVDSDTHVCPFPSGRGREGQFVPGDLVKVMDQPPTDEVPDMRGYTGEVVGVTTYGGSGDVIDVEFGLESPAPEGFAFLPRHLSWVGRWPDEDAA